MNRARRAAASVEENIHKVLYTFGLIAAAGYIWRYFNFGGLDRHRVRHALSTAVFHVFLPALAFGLIAGATVDRSFVAIPLTAAAATLACLAAGYGIYHFIPGLRQIPRPALGVLLLSSAFGNVTYMGLPVINETLGPQYAYVAILYDLLATTPVLLTLGVFIAARTGSGKAVSLRSSLKRVFLLPPLWGVALGMAVHLLPIKVPALILDTAALMGRAVIPVMIFTVGLALDFRDMRRLPLTLPALAVKLFLAPVIAWWAGSLLGVTGSVLQGLVLEGAMPVMVLSLVIADEFGLDVPLAATCIAFSTLASLVTAPLMLRLLA
jgi:malate permease and related proteins